MSALRTVLLYHFNKGIFIGAGLETGVTNLLKSLQGSNIKVIFVSGAIATITVNIVFPVLKRMSSPPKNNQTTDSLLWLWCANPHFDPLFPLRQTTRCK